VACRAAEGALAMALAATAAKLDHDRRCAEPELNLVVTITPDRWSAIAGQLGGGNGGELRGGGQHRAKFCSAYSSCALAVNTFGPFDETKTLELPGVGSYSGNVEFEAQRSASVQGYKPNLDMVAEPESGDWLFAENKCLEYLRPHTTAFSDAFVAKAKKLLATETAQFYAAFAQANKDGQHPYELLDAAQLLKHFLAAKIAADEQRVVTLAYLFWEPADATDHTIFAAHRREIDSLASALVDDHVRLASLSYRELWSHWEGVGDAALANHVAALRSRYDVALGAIA
jgi:hypothetical protein